MSGVAFDTSVYISALRQGDVSVFSTRRSGVEGKADELPLWLSAVVLEELYVGAIDRRMKKLLARLENEFAKVGRLLVPLQSDWTACGQVLALIGEKYGHEVVGRTRMTNDALIAMSAARNGFTIRTRNADDFKKIGEFRSLQLEEV